ncbi:MAG: histidine triad nucleotide-binding protein [Chloroflexi bacterium]|jgi:histidine triad (HIT) family protein|nr:histidine triad nucleotide-binding protein [Chloroflexota bacterium]
MCLFCQIVSGKIPSDTVFEDSELLAFRDINPQAPVHILIIPKKHIDSIAEVENEDAYLVGKISLLANKLAKEEGIAESGYRLVTNCRDNGGQLIKHLHFHLLGGRQLSGNLG